MEKKADKNNTFSFHMLFGTFCIAYSIGVALRLYIPELYSGEVEISGFYWLVFYFVASFVIFQFMHSLIGVIPNVIVPYMLLIGCSEGVTCTSMCSYFTRLPWYSYTVGAVVGSFAGLSIILFLYPNGGLYLFQSNTAGNILSGISCGMIVAWIVTPMLFPDGATEVAGNIPLICYCIATASMIPTCMFLSLLVKRCSARSQMKYEEERQQVMKDQELFTERCARAEAEKKAKANAEQERARKEHERQKHEKQERARKEQEERNRRYNQQYRSNNRSSSSSGESSRNYTGSWNKNSSSYFKGCSTKAELKRRYRQLCKKLHPDCPRGNAESFRIMMAEYNRLSASMAG